MTWPFGMSVWMYLPEDPVSSESGDLNVEQRVSFQYMNRQPRESGASKAY
jgi:hypothetical protein